MADELTRARIKLAKLPGVMDELDNLRKISNDLRKELRHAQAMLSGNETTPTVAASAVARGIDEHEPREG